MSGASLATTEERLAYEALQQYTLTHPGSGFIHQHVVDAWAAQHATAETKPIGITFALIGLYLHVDKHFTGRQVQRVHMLLGRRKHEWPSFPLPRQRGTVTVLDVMAAPEGAARDRAISGWCASVWEAYGACHAMVRALAREHGIA